MSERVWWWPQLKDDEWREQLRLDYPEDAGAMTDDELDDHYGEHGWKYVDTWDHLGDARSQFEHLADAFLKLVSEAGKSPADFPD